MIAKLVIASGKRAGRAISMKRDKLLIGRAEECDLRPLSEDCLLYTSDAADE